MTPCFTALYYAAAAALFSYMADGGPRVEYPPCCLVEVGGIDGGRESIDFVSKDSPHEARRNVALTPQTYDNRPGGTNPVTRLGNLTGKGRALAGPTIVPEPGETVLLLLGLCLIVFEFHCRRSAARKRELEQEREGERSSVPPRFPHPSR